MNTCWRCNAPTAPTDKFCGACAAPLTGVAHAPPSPPAHSPPAYAPQPGTPAAAPPWASPAQQAAPPPPPHGPGFAPTPVYQPPPGLPQQPPAAPAAPYAPPAISDMKIAGSEAFDTTADAASLQAPVGLPPTGAMMPFPGAGPVAYAPAPDVAQAQRPAVASPPPVATPSPPALKAELRGFLFSFHNDPNGRFWPLCAGAVVVGRADSGETLDVEIDDPTTSSRHAVLSSLAPGRLVIQDCGSTNGTFVNDQPIGHEGSMELRDGDRVRFGGYNAAIRLVSR